VPVADQSDSNFLQDKPSFLCRRCGSSSLAQFFRLKKVWLPARGNSGTGREVYRRELYLTLGDGRIGRHELNLNITSFSIFLLEFELWDACLE